ncbi:MAG: molybdopterin-dependent oxidoreductase [Thalassobaculaceae bacterium]
MTRLALMIDLERCTGCKSCEAACKTENGLGPGERRNRVVWFAGEEQKQDSDLSTPLDFLALSCQQCERPACIRACPVNPKAITKDPTTGIVRVNEDTCVGCGECVTACPYGAMGYDSNGHHAVKCDLCFEHREEGGITTACASVCPTNAITFGARDDLESKAHSMGRKQIDNDPFLLGPATIYLDRKQYQNGPFDAKKRIIPSVLDTGYKISQREIDFPYGFSRDERKADRIEAGGCNICFNSCTAKFHFHNDRLVKVTGNDEDPILKGKVCPKSQLSLQLYSSKERLTQPLKRIGNRGENKFEPISWKQALDEISIKLAAIKSNFGSESLGLFSGTRTGTLTNRGYIRMFAKLWGTPNFVTTEPFCSSGKNLAYSMTQGYGGPGNTYTEEDMGSASLHIYWGDNQAETRPVHFGMINDWRLNHGARMIVIDPRKTVTASKADWHIPIRPGGDMALSLSIAYHILSNNLHDKNFCDSWVLGWQKWRDFILQKQYTPEWAAEIADLTPERIRILAEEIAGADGCIIYGSRGINQHMNSTQSNRVLMFLAAITGNWGRPGGAYFNMSASLPIDLDIPENRLASITKPKLRTSPIGWTTAILEGKPYDLKAMIVNNNPMALWPDQNKTREALAALELLIHIDIFPNETSAWADYVLPAATGIEKGEVGRACEDRRIVWIDKMMEAPGQAKPDGWIWIELGKRFGFQDVLLEDWKDPRKFWDEALIGNIQMRGVTQKRLHSNPYRWVRFPVPSEDAPEIQTLYLEGTTAAGAPEGHRFPTKSGKLEFWTEELNAKFKPYGLTAYPEFYGERESLIDMAHMEIIDDDGSDGILGPFASGGMALTGRIVQPEEAQPSHRIRSEGFHLELLTGRPAAPHFHSWTHYSWQAQEMWPDLYAQIHPITAGELSIQDGDLIEVESKHGAIQAKAWVFPGIRRHAVFLPIGWGERQPFNPWRPVNFLTDKTQRDPISEQTNLKSLLCKVTKKATG